MQNAKNNSINTQLMILSALFTALIAVGAFIKIPAWPVPFTLQFMFTNMAGILLGRKYGAIATGMYVAVGLLGLPIFTAGGGIGYILHPTFGYMIGMIVGSYVAGMFREKIANFNVKTTFIAGLLNMTIVYLIGVPYFIGIMKIYTGSDMAIKSMLVVGFVMTLPGDIVKCAVSSLLSKRIGKYVNGQ